MLSLQGKLLLAAEICRVSAGLVGITEKVLCIAFLNVERIKKWKKKKVANFVKKWILVMVQ